METAMDYLPEEYFEVKNNSLYYHPPDDSEEFQKHYEMFWPVRLWVNEELETFGIEPNTYSILGVWAAATNNIKFRPGDFDEVVF